jgi:arylsulfatase B
MLLASAAAAAAAAAAGDSPDGGAAAAAAVGAPLRPHILLHVVDDWGWANWGVHSPDNPEVVTPNLDAIAAAGVVLDRHYVFPICPLTVPLRAADGAQPRPRQRLELSHHTAEPGGPDRRVHGHPAQHDGRRVEARERRDATHFAGKFDVGMATPDHTPAGRGYSTTLNYWSPDNDYWNQQDSGYGCSSAGADSGAPAAATVPVDLWNTTGPARGLNNSATCSQANQAPGCVYEDDLFVTRVLSTIADHDPATPLFLTWATHAVHAPYEVPAAYFNKFAAINDTARRFYSAMVNHLDDTVGTVVGALKARGLWDNLLWVTMSDNGGPVSSRGPRPRPVPPSSRRRAWPSQRRTGGRPPTRPRLPWPASSTTARPSTGT